MHGEWEETYRASGSSWLALIGLGGIPLLVAAMAILEGRAAAWEMVPVAALLPLGLALWLAPLRLRLSRVAIEYRSLFGGTRLALRSEIQSIGAPAKPSRNNPLMLLEMRLKDGSAIWINAKPFSWQALSALHSVPEHLREFVPGFGGHWLFIRCTDESDETLLQALGVRSHARVQREGARASHVAIADDGVWTMLMEDWHHTLYNHPGTVAAVERLAQRYDLFHCSVGDADYSFSFSLFQDGKLVRRYSCDDSGRPGAVTPEDTGVPLPGEAAALASATQIGKVFGLTACLGAKVNYKREECRIYAIGLLPA